MTSSTETHAATQARGVHISRERVHEVLAAHLRHGDRRRLAAELGVSTRQIYNACKGGYPDLCIRILRHMGYNVAEWVLVESVKEQ